MKNLHGNRQTYFRICPIHLHSITLLVLLARDGHHCPCHLYLGLLVTKYIPSSLRAVYLAMFLNVVICSMKVS